MLIGVITFLFFTGNSILNRSSTGLRASYTESLTGDLIIEKKTAVTMNLFGANAPVIDSYFTIPQLPAAGAIRALVQAMPEVAGIAGQVSTKAYVECNGARSPALVCGVDGGDYFPLFPGIVLEEGRFLRTGETGVMLTKEAAATYGKKGERPARAGDVVLLTAAGETGFKIREAPVTGIFSYRSPGQYMNGIVITDAQTARVLSQIQVATADVEVPESALFLLDADEDALFSDTFAPPPEQSAPSPAPDAAAPEAAPAASGGGWNFLVVRLKPRVASGAFIARLNKELAAYDATALGWRLAAGGSAIISLMLSALFNGGIVLVSVAGIIAVVNILLIAVFKRTREIGSLRAIGAPDSCIRALVFGENALLGAAAGLAAGVCGVLFLLGLNALRLPLHNDVLANLFGGAVLTVDLSPPLAAAQAGVAVILSVVSSVYPVEMAVKIEPAAAIRQG
jgi:ABC-type lipoprotein release transport system permease subunit